MTVSWLPVTNRWKRVGRSRSPAKHPEPRPVGGGSACLGSGRQFVWCPAALIAGTAVLTLLVRVPLPRPGYIRLGDVGVYFAAFTFRAGHGALGRRPGDGAGRCVRRRPLLLTLVFHGVQGYLARVLAAPFLPPDLGWAVRETLSVGATSGRGAAVAWAPPWWNARQRHPGTGRRWSRSTLGSNRRTWPPSTPWVWNAPGRNADGNRSTGPR